MKWLETDTLTDQNISTDLAIGSYTSDADRIIICDAAAYQVAGNGDYVMYITHDIAAFGTHVVLPKTIMSAAAGENEIGGQSAPITMRDGDIVTVYIRGLPGDIATVDTIVRWFEYDACAFPAGAIEFTYTVYDSLTGLPVPGTQVWFTTDLGGLNVIWTGYSDAFGVARDSFGNKPFLDPGTYYIWKQRVGYTPDDVPDVEVVS